MDDYSKFLEETSEYEEYEKFLSETEAQQPPVSPNISALESAGKGLVHSSTLGFADEIGGGVNAALHLGSKILPYDSPYDSTEQAYVEGRDEDREKYKEAEEANPGSYMAGEFVGTALSSMLPGLNVAKGGVVAKSAAQGAIEGAGRSESDDAVGIAKDAGITAAASGAFSKAGDSLGNLYNYLSKKAKDIAVNRGSKALGYTKGLRKGREDQVQKITEEALDRGHITPLSSTEDMIDKTKALRNEASQGFDNVVKNVNSLGMDVDRERMTMSMIEDLKGKYYDPKIEPGVSNKFKDLMDKLYSDVKTPEDLQIVKDKINRYGWNDQGRPRDTIEGEMYRDVWKSLQNNYSDAVGLAAKETKDPKILQDYLKAKQDYAFSSNVKKPLEDKLSSEKGNRMIGLTDMIVGAGGVGYGSATGDWEKSAMAFGAKKGLDRYGNQLASVGLNKLSKAMSAGKIPAKFANVLNSAFSRNGANGVAATDYLLRQQYPEYREMTKSDESSED